MLRLGDWQAQLVCDRSQDVLALTDLPLGGVELACEGLPCLADALERGGVGV